MVNNRKIKPTCPVNSLKNLFLNLGGLSTIHQMVYRTPFVKIRRHFPTFRKKQNKNPPPAEALSRGAPCVLTLWKIKTQRVSRVCQHSTPWSRLSYRYFPFLKKKAKSQEKIKTLRTPYKPFDKTVDSLENMNAHRRAIRFFYQQKKRFIWQNVFSIVYYFRWSRIHIRTYVYNIAYFSKGWGHDRQEECTYVKRWRANHY